MATKRDYKKEYKQDLKTGKSGPDSDQHGSDRSDQVSVHRHEQSVTMRCPRSKSHPMVLRWASSQSSLRFYLFKLLPWSMSAWQVKHSAAIL
jgi:hypothetical protein